MMRNLSLIVITFFAACGVSKQEEVLEIKKQAIEIHDEVMPFMEDLRKVRKQLMAEADSLISSDSIKAVAFNEAAAAISTANEGMMQWMRDFEPEFDGTDEEAIQYFKDQKVAIEKVKEDMLGSFEKGKGLLEVQ